MFYTTFMNLTRSGGMKVPHPVMLRKSLAEIAIVVMLSYSFAKCMHQSTMKDLSIFFVVTSELVRSNLMDGL